MSELPVHPPITLALCMIVRDEEAYLAQCLASVQTLVDEIIIVDTGSQDQTCHIAQQFGAKVFQALWKDDFSQARNLSLSHASSAWILVLDADEVLAPESIPWIRQLLQTSPRDAFRGYQAKIRNFIARDSDTERVEHFVLRLFPNHPDLRYQGLIHEQLLSQNPDLIFERLTCPEFLIFHYGYTSEMMQARDKTTRNIRLLEAAIAQEPKHAFHFFNLGLTYRVKGDNFQALTCFQRAISLAEQAESPPNYLASAYAYLAAVWIALGDYQEALNTCLKAPRDCEDIPDYWVNLGFSYQGLKDYPQAIKSFEQALMLREQRLTTAVYDASALSWKPLVGIGNAYLFMNQWEQAESYFQQALAAYPEKADILLGLLRLAFFRQDYPQAQAYLKRLSKKSLKQQISPPIWAYEKARLLKYLNQPQAAQKILLNLYKKPLPAQLRYGVQFELATLYLQTQNWPAALEILEGLEHSEDLLEAIGQYYLQDRANEMLLALYNQLISRSPEPLLRRQRGIVLFKLGQLDLARQDLEQVLETWPRDPYILHNLGALSLNQGLFESAESYFLQALTQDAHFIPSLLDLAKLKIRTHNLEMALNYLSQVKELAPQNLALLELWAFVHHQSGDLENACEAYLDILDLNPRHLHALIQLGYILLNHGQNHEAIQLFERALSYDKTQFLAYNGLGLIYLNQLRFEEAANAFFLALRLNPEQSESQKGYQLAQKLIKQQEKHNC